MQWTQGHAKTRGWWKRYYTIQILHLWRPCPWGWIAFNCQPPWRQPLAAHIQWSMREYKGLVISAQQRTTLICHPSYLQSVLGSVQSYHWLGQHPNSPSPSAHSCFVLSLVKGERFLQFEEKPEYFFSLLWIGFPRTHLHKYRLHTKLHFRICFQGSQLPQWAIHN